MNAPSYASAAAQVSGPSTPPNNHGKTCFEQQVQELSQPQPQTITLIATLQLLAPLEPRTDVFLMRRSYMQNWLVWAYHQKVIKTEASRVEAAVRLAAERLGLKAPYTDMEHTDPGPIDASIFSIEGHALLLKPEVVVVDDSTKKQTDLEIPDIIRRVKSLPMTEISNEDQPLEEDSMDIKDKQLLCCAVPAPFYEVRVECGVCAVSIWSGCFDTRKNTLLLTCSIGRLSGQCTELSVTMASPYPFNRIKKIGRLSCIIIHIPQLINRPLLQ
jgi:hypothetical protein